MRAREILEGLRSALPDELALERGLLRLASAHAERDRATQDRAIESLGTHLARVEASSDLAGRVAMLFDVQGPRPDLFQAAATRLGASCFLGRRAILFAGRQRAYDSSGVIPMSFLEAVADLREREPTVASSLETAAAEVRRVYGGYRDPSTHRRVYPHGFALARSIELEVTQQVHALLVRHLQRGTDAERTAAKIAELGGWAKSYARTVVRTNTTTAYSAGRLREAKRLADDGIVTGFEFRSAGDSDVRRGRAEDHGENHAAMDGVRARHDDPIWGVLAPPLGYNAVERGAMILTDMGEKPIEEVRVGDRVWTFQGEYACVYGVDAKIEKKRMVTIVMDDDHRVSVSEEHPVLTRRGWIAAGKLRDDDEIAVAGCAWCSKHVPSWRQFCDPTCRNRALAKAKKERAGSSLDRTCGTCGKSFRARSAKAGRFCSRPCKHEAERDHRACKNCGAEIKTRGKKKSRMFCSKKCNGIFSRRPDRACDMCGRSIREVMAALARKTGTKRPTSKERRFCSFGCWRRFNGETSIEKTVREYLEANQLPYVQSEQVGRYEVDFVLPTFAVAIECDGTYWHASEKVKARDAKKDALLVSKGYTVVRLSETEIKASDAWKGRLYAVCKDQVDRAKRAVGGAS